MEKPSAPVRATKKLATRRALIAAAQRRFHRDGFERSTIDDICADAGVSRRTFFRYFDSKEALAFPHRDDRLQRFHALLDASFADGKPFDGLRRIATTFAREYSAKRVQLLQQQKMIDAVPDLAAREHEIDRDWEHALSAAFLPHLAAGPDAECRAQVLAGATIGVIRATMRYWFDHDGRPDLARLGLEAIDGLERGFLAQRRLDGQ
jgi:AcrR family transcriptional regulator